MAYIKENFIKQYDGECYPCYQSSAGSVFN